jgi:hypothetical protein
MHRAQGMSARLHLFASVRTIVCPFQSRKRPWPSLTNYPVKCNSVIVNLMYISTIPRFQVLSCGLLLASRE